MSGEEQKWVVLIQKKPRGPFTEHEINRLLDEGIVSRTDLAIRIDSTDSTMASQWRLLWQFREFDRRVNEEKINAAPAVVERREEALPTVISKKIEAILPEELHQIAPEDLIPKVSKNDPFIAKTEKLELPRLVKENTKAPHRYRFMYALLALSLVIFLGVRILYSFWGNTKTLETKEIEAVQSVPPPPSSAVRQRPESSLPRAPIPEVVREPLPPQPEPSSFSSRHDDDDRSRERDEEEEEKPKKKTKREVAKEESDEGEEADTGDKAREVEVEEEE